MDNVQFTFNQVPQLNQFLNALGNGSKRNRCAETVQVKFGSKNYLIRMKGEARQGEISLQELGDNIFSNSPKLIKKRRIKLSNRPVPLNKDGGRIAEAMNRVLGIRMFQVPAPVRSSDWVPRKRCVSCAEYLNQAMEVEWGESDAFEEFEEDL